MKFKISTIQVIILAACILIPFLSHAQPSFPDNTTDVPPDTPVDGGLSLLVAAGVGYGTKKLKERRQK